MRDYQLLQLTQINHLLLATLKNVEVAVDMTVGNGHDTIFLASHFSNVIGFDIQKNAILTAQATCPYPNVRFICDDHCHVDKYLTAADLFVFNLGWLPNSDKAISTPADRTIETLEKCRRLLKPGGLISLMVYNGSEKQRSDHEAIKAWLDQQKDFCIQVISLYAKPTAPVLYVLALEKAPR